MPSSAGPLRAVDDLSLLHVRTDEQASQPAGRSTKDSDLVILCRGAKTKPADPAPDRHFYRAIRNLRDLGFRERVADLLRGEQQLVQRVLVRITIALKRNAHDARSRRVHGKPLDHGIVRQARSQRLRRQFGGIPQHRSQL
jgi:hypothetical protein